MDPNQQQLLLTGGAKKEGTYVDEVFSTYLYKGTKPDAHSIVNGIKFGNSNSGNSVLFDDHLDYLELAHSTDLCFGSGDFTIECWAYYRGDFDSYDAIFGNWTGAGADGYVLETVGSGATTDLEFYYYNDSNTFVGPVQGGTVTKNQWNHLCVCRSGNTIRVFVNGTMHGSGTSISTPIQDGTSTFTVGGRVAGAGWWNGYITDLRVTKGQALYTSNFTPSTDPLTTTSQGATASNVKLLCCNKEIATDSTVAPGTITPHGFNGPHAKPFGRFTATDGEGGMLWIKSRTNSYFHVLQDTVRGAGKVLKSNSSDGQMNATHYLGSFDNAGFSFNVDADNDVQNSNQDFVSWSFRKAPGFFDVVQYSGSASGVVKTVDHNLGCIPGCIIVKKISNDGNNWACYHRAMDSANPQEYSLSWSTTNPRSTNTGINFWGDFLPTSTQFKVGDSDTGMGDPSGQWIAYLFGGGESLDDQARSVRFDDTNGADYLNVPDDPAWDIGAVDFTMECWARFHSHNSHDGIVHNVQNGGWTNGSWIFEPVGGNLHFYYMNTGGSTGNIAGAAIPLHSWQHMAVTKSGNTITIYQNGIKTGSGTISGTIRDGSNPLTIGGQCVGTDCDADISNLRITIGQVLYTNSFTPSTKPLTTTSQGAVAGNVKLLCCNQSTVTGSTVTTGTITSNGSPVANVMSPFDDPDCYKFGADGNENIVSCGSYGGNGATKGAEVYCGWEPQYVAIRCIRRPDGSGGFYGSGWYMLDSTRTIASGTNSGGNRGLQTQETNAEATETNCQIQLTATGFKVTGQNIMNADGGEYMYIAIRNNDAKVGKPPKVGLDVFAMDYGNASTTIPSYYSNFPVDLGLEKRYNETYDWWLSSRLTGSTYVKPSSLAGQSGPAGTWGTNYMFDSNLGYIAASWANSVTIAYMWKRYNGVDVVPYTGNGLASRDIPHNLGVAPEMVWYKRRDATEDWVVYNQYLNGGTNPGEWYLTLNDTTEEGQSSIYFANTEPTAKYLTVNQSNRVNTNNQDYIAVLFASGTDADGNQISKCGAYDGSANSQTILLGFKPQFAIVKRIDASSPWMVMDTKRGWSGSGSKDLLVLDATGPQTTAYSYTGESVANGFTLNGGVNETNANGCKYIYYAHA
jgi:hypothetical protein